MNQRKKPLCAKTQGQKAIIVHTDCILGRIYLYTCCLWNAKCILSPKEGAVKAFFGKTGRVFSGLFQQNVDHAQQRARRIKEKTEKLQNCIILLCNQTKNGRCPLGKMDSFLGGFNILNGKAKESKIKLAINPSEEYNNNMAGERPHGGCSVSLKTKTPKGQDDELCPRRQAGSGI